MPRQKCLLTRSTPCSRSTDFSPNQKMCWQVLCRRAQYSTKLPPFCALSASPRVEHYSATDVCSSAIFGRFARSSRDPFLRCKMKSVVAQVPTHTLGKTANAKLTGARELRGFERNLPKSRCKIASSRRDHLRCYDVSSPWVCWAGIWHHR
jgi:hypothetical protein